MLETLIPTLFNAGSQLLQNQSNLSNYNSAQERANEFAREERIAAQNYNSLDNQFAQMQRLGMNPNLLQGQDFLSTQPVQNQSVSPPSQYRDSASVPPAGDHPPRGARRTRRWPQWAS